MNIPLRTILHTLTALSNSPAKILMKWQVLSLHVRFIYRRQSYFLIRIGCTILWCEISPAYLWYYWCLDFLWYRNIRGHYSNKRSKIPFNASIQIFSFSCSKENCKNNIIICFLASSLSSIQQILTALIASMWTLSFMCWKLELHWIAWKEADIKEANTYV